MSNWSMTPITVLIADDSLIVREGLRGLLEATSDFKVVGVARDYDELISSADQLEPQVVISDIRMPPTFQQEGVEACRQVRRRHPGTGVVILSQYDDPDYAIALLSEGASGCAYLLKDRIYEGEQLARAVKEVSCGGSVLDPRIAESLIAPVQRNDLSSRDRDLLRMLAQGKTIPAIAIAFKTTSADIADSVDGLFLHLARDATAGRKTALKQLRLLHQAIVQREEQGEMLSRLLPTGVAERLRISGRRVGESEQLEVTVLMSDVRGYSAIAETSDPLQLCEQLNAYRARASDAVIAHQGTVMQFVGDAVMAVFGAPEPLTNHADHALDTATAIHQQQAALNEQWSSHGLPPFELGIGLSTGIVAAALLGSEERMEYSVVGDAVNLTQRLQQLATGGATVLSDVTYSAVRNPPMAERLGPSFLPGRSGAVTAYRVSVPPDR